MSDKQAQPDIDDLDPDEIPAKATGEYSDKVDLATVPLLVLALLAGAYIAFGSVFSLVVLASPEGALAFGLQQLLAGLAFSLGLILVMVAGAELFTGNTLMVTLWVQNASTAARIGRAWGLAYAGNLVGSVAIVVLFFIAGGHLAGDGGLGVAALEIAEGKTEMRFHAILASGILANMLVCLAVWLSFSARTTQGKILAIIGPISAFVAAELEHSVANMSLIPMGLLVKHLASPEFWGQVGQSATDFPTLGIGWGLWNLLWATIGNIIGGAIIATAYWASYGRRD